MKIDFVPFQELRPHKLVKDLPRWAQDDPQYLSLVDDIAARGIDQPLFVVGDAIVDGVLRWRAAKRMQLASVPVVQRKEDEVPELAMQSMLQRRHLTKSARAYICYPLMDAAWMAVSRRQSSINNPLRGLLIIDSYVEQIGINKNLYHQAKEIHEIFATHPDLKARFEPKILAGVDEETGHVVGLGGIVAGLNYLLKGAKRGGPPKEPTRQLELFTEGIEAIKVRFGFWQKFNLEQKEKAVAAIRGTVTAMPGDLRAEWKRAITLAEREETETKGKASA